SLLLPLTFGMQPVSAIILLSSMYWGALFGGSVTSILFNIPGEPSSVATTFDGYPMARDGRPTTALATAFGSAAFGALVGEFLIAVEEEFQARAVSSRVDWKEVFRALGRLPHHGIALLRSAAIGCWMGITPGGPTAASFMSYGIAKRFSRNGARFGSGEPE